MGEKTGEAGLLGSCGLYCRACPRYRVTMADGKNVLAAGREETYEAFYCNGCHSDKLSEFCQSCIIRLCAKGRGIHHCGECAAFPCADLSSFSDAGKKFDGARHRAGVVENLARVPAVGAERWLLEQDRRWRCSCGFIFSGYETQCFSCGKILDSFANRPSVEK